VLNHSVSAGCTSKRTFSDTYNQLFARTMAVRPRPCTKPIGVRRQQPAWSDHETVPMTIPARRSIFFGYIISCCVFAPTIFRLGSGSWPTSLWDVTYVVLLAPLAAPGFAMAGPFLFGGVSLSSLAGASILTCVWLAIMVLVIALVHRFTRAGRDKTQNAAISDPSI
jgi:hypothetical protein